jgi:(p)ppGpp synthase/HD superfamily hydrolase
LSELELLEKAIAIAVDAHRGQKDRYDAPYILHPLRVMARVQSPVEKTVAILHDVVEDTDWTFQDLQEEGFPEEIVDALDCLTKREGEPYERLVKRSVLNALARRVKIADLEDNMDLRRFPRIAPKDAARLRKYLAAWRALSEIK